MSPQLDDPDKAFPFAVVGEDDAGGAALRNGREVARFGAQAPLRRGEEEDLGLGEAAEGGVDGRGFGGVEVAAVRPEGVYLVGQGAGR